MRRTIAVLIFLIPLASLALAQTPEPVDCPSIWVVGPAGGFVDVGELADYTAVIGKGDEDHAVEFIWSLSAGRIKEGQGTKSIKVVQPNSSLTVTVKVKGLPAGCPSEASELCCSDRGPEPIKLNELQANQRVEDLNIRHIAQTAHEHPNDQLYILAIDVRGKNSVSFQQRSEAILTLLSESGVPRDRITMERVVSGVELFQFWRVPPGAENPRCDECGELEKTVETCATITVTGPAGVPEPGEEIEFVGNLSGTVPVNVRYRWIAEGVKILHGQGTLRLRVLSPATYAETVTATLEVIGLPNSCPNSVTETAPVCACEDPVLFDEFQRLPRRDEMVRIGAAVQELEKSRPVSKLLFIEYFPKTASQSKIKNRVKWLTQQVTRSHKWPTSSFDIITSDSIDGESLTKVYFVGPEFSTLFRNF